MAWQDSLIPMVRSLIGDTDHTNYEFSDEKLETAIVVGGLVSSQEYSYINDYTFNLAVPDITPDPVSQNDAEFIALASLKAACNLDINRYQAGVRSGIKVRDGDSSVDLTSRFSGYQDILKEGPCKSYQMLVRKMQITGASGSMNKGKAVMSPMSHVDFGWCGSGKVGYFFNCFADHINSRNIRY